jgi:hypothetical protein
MSPQERLCLNLWMESQFSEIGKIFGLVFWNFSVLIPLGLNFGGDLEHLILENLVTRWTGNELRWNSETTVFGPKRTWDEIYANKWQPSIFFAVPEGNIPMSLGQKLTFYEIRGVSALRGFRVPYKLRLIFSLPHLMVSGNHIRDPSFCQS